ncbi:hypothetical protein KCP76_00875 [Salmonella enterica subsp. enterica serovar Weltevreden]|nr:hypothetical protein KCP76_00875 [Salmonella enterica subsp. enterica serovar Weltevreden]
MAGGRRPACTKRSPNSAPASGGGRCRCIHLRPFSLCLLGTFHEVRSGVLVSVHAFASDPGARNVYLAFYGAGHRRLAAALFAVRGHRVRSRVNNTRCGRARSPAARQQRVLLMAAMLVVLLGTLLPLLVLQTAGAGTRHFGGEPFFNTMFTADGSCPCCWGWGRCGALGRDQPRQHQETLLTTTVSTLNCCRYFAMAAGR